MQIRYLHLQQLVRSKRITLQKVRTDKNVSDLLTKQVSKETLERLRPKLGLIIVPPPDRVGEVGVGGSSSRTKKSMMPLTTMQPITSTRSMPARPGE
jgi:hypothetical protein